VVWEDYREDWRGELQGDLYLKDLLTGEERQLTLTYEYETHPHFGENDLVVYQREKRNGRGELTRSDIYVYDFSRGRDGRAIAVATGGININPRISGQEIVWEKIENKRHNHRSIRYKNLNGGGIVTIPGTEDSLNEFPDVMNGKIVWQGLRNGQYDIFLHDIHANVTENVTNDIHWQIRPKFGFAGNILFMDNFVNELPNEEIWSIFQYDPSARELSAFAMSELEFVEIDPMTGAMTPQAAKTVDLLRGVPVTSQGRTVAWIRSDITGGDPEIIVADF
jgi:hypothetical protein